MEIVLAILGLVGIIAGAVGVFGPDESVKSDAQKVAGICIVLFFLLMFTFL